MILKRAIRFVVENLVLAGLLLAASSARAQETDPSTDVWRTWPRNFTFEMVGGAQSFLGVGVAEIGSSRARELKLPEERGVEITRVEENSAAAKAGIKTGDAVLEYNGQRVEGTEQFIRLVRETPVSREVRLLISRNGATQTVSLVMGGRKDPVLLGRNNEFFEMPQIALPELPNVFITGGGSRLGIEAETLTPQLGEFFGAKEGVLVRSVTPGSAAEKAGIKAGDVLVRIDGNAVNSPEDVRRSVRLTRGRAFAVELVRERKPLTLNVTANEPGAEESVPRSPARTVKM